MERGNARHYYTIFLSGELDLKAFTKNLNAQVNAGASGIILGGTLGEASTLTAVEKAQLVQTTLKEVGEKVAVVLNIAEQSTQDAIAAAKSAQAQGAHGLMLLPPCVIKRQIVKQLLILMK